MVCMPMNETLVSLNGRNPSCAKLLATWIQMMADGLSPCHAPPMEEATHIDANGSILNGG